MARPKVDRTRVGDKPPATVLTACGGVGAVPLPCGSCPECGMPSGRPVVRRHLRRVPEIALSYRHTAQANRGGR